MSDTEAKTENNVGATAWRPEPWPSNQSGIQVVPGGPVDLSLRSIRNEAEIYAINYALKQTSWNRKRAAKLLGISYRGLLYKLRRHNITPTVQRS